MKKLFYLLILSTLIACAPKVTTKINGPTTPLDYTEEVTVLSLNDEVPINAVEIGTLKVGESGFTVKCDWENVIEKARTEARKSGGNILKITEHKTPDAFSSCHRIKATIYKVNASEIARLKSNYIETIDSTWDYALLYVYRPRGHTGSLISYDLYLGDSLICRVKNNFKQQIKITKTGLNTLWAKTESKEEVPINVEFGREYYLRCGVGMGIMVGRPKMELVNKKQGLVEFNQVKLKK